MSSFVEIELQPLGRTIRVERGASLRTVLGEHGVEFPCGGQGFCGGCRVRRIRGALAVDDAQIEILTRDDIARGWRLACRCTVENGLTLEIGQWETVILADNTRFEFTPREGLGIAVDLGTTTVVAQLLDLSSGKVLAVRSAINPLTAYGADIMSRVHAAVTERKGPVMVERLRGMMGRFLRELSASARRDGTPVDRVTIAGNTVMHHLFCGIDLEPLSRAPFEIVQGGLQRFSARELGWELTRNPPVHFLPCLGSFIGSDILCGILSTGMPQRDTPALLVDLGTNGEIVVGNRYRMLCASAAAGPAFEGGCIRTGMRATRGAIHTVDIKGGELFCRVLGDVAPRGICGSGLVDAVATGLDLGLIEPNGRLGTAGRCLELAPRVVLTQSDIRQLQLAKAAIAAGTRILRRRFGEQAAETIPIHLAGAFGNYVRRASALRIGLLDEPGENVSPAGNTALLGAKMALCAEPCDGNDFAALRSRIEHVPLAADPDFQRIYVEELAFPQ